MEHADLHFISIFDHHKSRFTSNTPADTATPDPSALQQESRIKRKEQRASPAATAPATCIAYPRTLQRMTPATVLQDGGASKLPHPPDFSAPPAAPLKDFPAPCRAVPEFFFAGE